MSNQQIQNETLLLQEIANHLGLDITKMPVTIDEKSAAKALGVKGTTLSVWRSTKRYPLPYIKVGRLVKYRVKDIATFLENRTTGNI